MDIPQIAYSYVPPAALQGQTGTIAPSTTATGVAEVALDCGLFLVGGSADQGVKLPTAAADVTNTLRGVSLYQDVKEPIKGLPRFKVGDAVPVLRKGQVWVPVVTADVATDQIPFVVHSGGDAGKIRGTAGAGPDGTIPAAGCRVIKGAVAGGLALVEINLP